jgi:hypothetical protein
MFSIYFKTHMILLFSRYKADFLHFPPENPANYVSILMYELQRKAPSERRKSHFRGPRFQNVRHNRLAIWLIFQKISNIYIIYT